MKTFIEINVQFKEGPLQDIQQVEAESSTPPPPLEDEKENESSLYHSSDYDSDDEDEHVDPVDPNLRTKWDDKTIEVAGEFLVVHVI